MPKNLQKSSILKAIGVVLHLFLFCCTWPDITPKPVGYARVHYPDRSAGYRQFSSPDCPYTFEIPAYATTERKERQFGDRVEDPCWMNVVYKDLNSKLYLSYKPLDDTTRLVKLLQDTHFMTYKHQIKADYINEYPISNADSSIYGLFYAVGGNSASAVQFYLTDSSDHFIRGSLYFHSQPNFDSIRPVLKFIEKDVHHFIETFRWSGQRSS